MTDDGPEENGKDSKLEMLVEAVAAAEAAGEIPVLEVEMTSGVKLTLRPTPKHFIYAVTSRFEVPQVPKVWLEKKQRHEENANDPQYRVDLELYAIDVANAATDATILRGSSVAFVPDHLPGPNDDAWIDEMKLLGMPMVESERARYLAWVKGVACVVDDDIHSLLEALGRLTGVAEADVLDAVEKFRSVAERSGDNGTPGAGN